MDKWQKVPYKRGEVEGVRYLRNGKFTPSNRVPHDVAKTLEYKDEVETNLFTKPCLFCDSQASMERYCNMVMVQLCEYHYYNRNIGKIAEQMRKEEERKSHGIETQKSKTRHKKSKSKVT